MGQKKISYQIHIPKNSKIKTVEASPELKKLFKKQAEKNHNYYLKEFLGSEKNFNIMMSAINKASHKSISPKVIASCQFCNGDNRDESYKKCTKYTLQMSITFIEASYEYINIVFLNRHIYKNKVELQKLTIKFFDCFGWLKDEGIMFFDLDKMCLLTLKSGFLIFSQKLKSSTVLDNLSGLNHSIDNLKTFRLDKKLLGIEDKNYTDLQLEFLESKYKFYKEELYIDNKKSEINHSNKEEVKITDDSKRKLTINQIALKLVYENEIVTKSNAKTIIKEYGHSSGDKLYNQFIYYSNFSNRKSIPTPLTKRKLFNKIKLFELVIEMLSNTHKQKAFAELKILKIKFESEFE